MRDKCLKMEHYSQTIIHKKLKATKAVKGEWILQWTRFVNEVELSWSQSTKGSTLYLATNNPFEPRLEIAAYNRENKQQKIQLPVVPLVWPAALELVTPSKASVFIAANVDIIDRESKEQYDFCEWEELIGKR